MAKGNGPEVIVATSIDPRYPPNAVLDPDEKSHWMTTGMYPQEVLVDFGERATVGLHKLP
jgi:heat shock protein beta-11